VTALQIFGIFFIIIHRFSLVKAAKNTPHPCKLHKERLTGICTGISEFFNCQRRNKDHCAHLNWLPNWQLNSKEALLYFTGLSEDVGRAKFVKKSPRLSI
jgi:hypothetical protein